MINQPKTLKEQLERIKTLMSINEFVSMSSDEQVEMDPNQLQNKQDSTTAASTTGTEASGLNPAQPTQQTAPQPVAEPTTQSTDLKSLIGQPITSVKQPLIDATKVFNSQGYYGKGSKKPTPAPASTSSTDQVAVNESFDTSLFYVNPLLFESVIHPEIIVEQVATGNKYNVNKTTGDVYRVDGSGKIAAIFQNNKGTYTCVGDCYGQTKMSSRFAQTAQSALTGKSLPPRQQASKTPVAGNPAEEIQKIVLEVSDSIRLLFTDVDFWKPFKNSSNAGILRLNDDEEAAVAAFEKWWTTDSGNTAKIEKIKTELLPKVTDPKQKEICVKNYNIIATGIVNNSTNGIITKLLGDTTDDVFRWSITLLDGSIKTYEVDTDF